MEGRYIFVCSIYLRETRYVFNEKGIYLRGSYQKEGRPFRLKTTRIGDNGMIVFKLKEGLLLGKSKFISE